MLVPLFGYVVDCYRRRGPFSTEHDWRAVSIGHLLAGPAWFAAAVLAAMIEIVLGRALTGWSIGLLAIPMVAGWMLQELVGSIEGAFWPNQYANTRNSEAHYHSTMHEVAKALGGKIDFLFVPTSTCGTLRGCSEYVRDHGLGRRSARFRRVPCATTGTSHVQSANRKRRAPSARRTAATRCRSSFRATA